MNISFLRTNGAEFMAMMDKVSMMASGESEKNDLALAVASAAWVYDSSAGLSFEAFCQPYIRAAKASSLQYQRELKDPH